MKRIHQKLGSIRSIIRGYLEEISLNNHRHAAKGKAWQKSADYETYLDTQLTRTYSKRQMNLPDRTVDLIDKISDYIDLSSFDVLCVGVRNTNEIRYFQSKQIKTIIGIDLFSEEDLVQVMDMHKMDFPNNSFNLIYSCHSLEHAFDAAQVAQEFIRVSRPGGTIVIEVPVNFQVQGADLIDFESYENILDLFNPHVEKILWAENEISQEKGIQSASRVIFSIKK